MRLLMALIRSGRFSLRIHSNPHSLIYLLILISQVNYYGMIRCCKAFLPILKQQAPSYKGSRILNIASMAGIGKSPMNLSAYCASKHAAAALSSSLRQELQVFGIQVSTVCPSFHGTPLVHTMHNMAQRQWDKMPLEKQQEYGEGKRKRKFCFESAPSHIPIIVRLSSLF